MRGLLIVLCWVAACALSGPAHAETAPRWQWPTPSPHQVVAPFDAPDQPYGAGHRGVDIAMGAAGGEVRAVEGGTVRFRGAVAGRPVVSVVHHDGLVSTYEPVRGSVEEGQEVKAGDVLGVVDPEAASASHCAPAQCLHLGARRGQDYLDPLLLLGERGPSVLLPWAGESGPFPLLASATGEGGTGEGRGQRFKLRPGGAPARPCGADGRR